MMKKYIALAVALMIAPAFAQEADAPKKDSGDRKARMEERKAEMLKKYDKDGDGVLSEEEKAAMQADRDAARKARGDKDDNGPRGEGRGPRGPRGEGKGPRPEGPPPSDEAAPAPAEGNAACSEGKDCDGKDCGKEKPALA